jgi:hypothetical protein
VGLLSRGDRLIVIVEAGQFLPGHCPSRATGHQEYPSCDGGDQELRPREAPLGHYREIVVEAAN